MLTKSAGKFACRCAISGGARFAGIDGAGVVAFTSCRFVFGGSAGSGTGARGWSGSDGMVGSSGEAKKTSQLTGAVGRVQATKFCEHPWDFQATKEAKQGEEVVNNPKLRFQGAAGSDLPKHTFCRP